MDELHLWSERFDKSIVITRHAQARMAERNIDNALLLDLIDNGEIKHKNIENLWIFKHYAKRGDNLICAAIVMKRALIIKTVMINWQLRE